MDVIEGVARLDWHDRAIGVGGKSMPLSVASLVWILESFPYITTEGVQDLFQLGVRHARRYVKAIELIIPWMMSSRPKTLSDEMEGITDEPITCKWRHDNPYAPTPEELAKLHYDLRTFTQYNTAEEYEASWDDRCSTPNIIVFTERLSHPKKPQVMQMLKEGLAVAAIERGTGVSAKTIRKWRNETLEQGNQLQAA